MVCLCLVSPDTSSLRTQRVTHTRDPSHTCCALALPPEASVTLRGVQADPPVLVLV